MVIFNSYVELPEGNLAKSGASPCMSLSWVAANNRELRMSRASSQEQRGKAWIINGDNLCNGIGINNSQNIIDNNNIIDNTSNDNI